VHYYQTSLFYDLQELILKSPLLRKYYYLFKALDLSELPDKNNGVGAKGYSRHAMLRAFIVKHFEQIKSVPRLIEYLNALPPLQELCGFELGCMPDESQFYRFLKDTTNTVVQDMRHKLNKKLIKENVIDMHEFMMDSKPVMAATKDNNFKNPRRNTTNKAKIPKRNPKATLSYYSCQIVNDKHKNMIFFWGYRTHALVTKEGVCLIEMTLPNKVTDQDVAIKLLKALKRIYRVKRGSLFLADKAYDVRDIYDYIVETLKSKAYIPLNPRNQKEDRVLGPHGCPICQAGLEMKSAGRWTEAKRERIKFRCPLKTSKKVSAQYDHACPAHHTAFDTGKCYGCTQYLDVTNDARAKVPRDSKEYKDTYKDRQVIEQYFARLGDREAEQTTHYSFKAIKNQISIAHLCMSLVAVAAAILLAQPNKMRCYRTFANSLKAG
jgi:hypothetical protein